jgi:hypothetical protein
MTTKIKDQIPFLAALEFELGASRLLGRCLGTFKIGPQELFDQGLLGTTRSSGPLPPRL